MSRGIQGGVTRRSIFASALVGIIALLVAGAAQATNYTVDTLNDSGGASNCSLRDAISAANGSPNGTSSCGSGGTGNDRITFSVTGEILLGGPLPTITDTVLSINGPTVSPGITIDGDEMFRVLTVGSSFTSSAELALNNLTITHGKAPLGAVGGGVFVETSSRLTVTNCTFLDNITSDDSGGAIAINAQANATVVNSTFAGNRAHGGGAILNTGTLTVTNSTLAGNRATDAIGGGILTGFHATSNIKGTILAANSPGDNCVNVHGDLNDEGYDLSDDDSCEFHGTESHNGVKDTELDLGPLADNGGPTETIALQTGSIAIDAIPQASCTYPAGLPNPCSTTGTEPDQLSCDQRGSIRPALGQSNCDIGAVEGVAAPSLGATGESCEDECRSQHVSCTNGAVNSDNTCVNGCRVFDDACRVSCDRSFAQSSKQCSSAEKECLDKCP